VKHCKLCGHPKKASDPTKVPDKKVQNWALKIVKYAKMTATASS